MSATLKNKEIVIGLLARDCKESLLRNIPRVEAIGEAFGDWHVIIYENDSRDGTTEALQQWARSNPHVIAICETTHQDTIPKKTARSPFPAKSVYRIERMARFRNRVLDEVKARFTPDIFCFIDIDVESFDPQNVIDAVEHAPADWGAIFASGHFLFRKSNGDIVRPHFQYDSYAFVPNNVDPMLTGDWIIQHNFHNVTSWMFDQMVQRNDYLSCNSAFNGIGFYQWEAISDLRYGVTQTQELKKYNACFCEHVPFNYEIRERGYKVYVAKKMEVTYYHKKYTLIRQLNHWLRSVKSRCLLALGKTPYLV